MIFFCDRSLSTDHHGSEDRWKDIPRLRVDTEMTMPSIFLPFISTTTEAFEYLVNEYGFHRKSEKAAGSEAWVVYENPTTRVTVHYELGAEPWVEIGRIEMRDGERVQPNSIGLDLLLRERGKPLGDEVTVPREIDSPELSRMIMTRAERLHTLGDDLLRGDFRAFQKLQTKAEKELRKREADLFGSQT